MVTMTILNGNNEPLAEASCVRPADEVSTGAVLRTSRPDRLLAYYFANRGRQVVLRQPDGTAKSATITSTRWQPRGRLWYVRTLAD
jgi:hypothetical protein